MRGGALRRAIHASTAVLAVAGIADAWQRVPYVLVGLAALSSAIEIVRLRHGPFRVWLARSVPVFRDTERTRPSGAWWLSVGYALAAWVPAPGAVAGILCGALADPAAAAIGTRFGRGAPKSIAGSLAAALVCAGVMLALALPPAMACLGGLWGMALERWSPVNDNLALPVGVAVFAGWIG